MTEPSVLEDTTSLGDWVSAIRIRDIISNVCQVTIDKIRPLPRYATTDSVINIFTRKVLVHFNNETTSVPATVTSSNFPWDIGSVVRVEGKLNNLYITEVMNGRLGINQPVMVNPYIGGGVFGTNLVSSFHWATAVALPTAGQCSWIGRWEVANSTFQNNSGVIEVSLHWYLFATVLKVYRIPFKFNDTSGAWVKVFPAEDSGTFNGWDFGLEIAVDSTGFELRTRQYATGTGFTPTAAAVNIRSISTPFNQVFASVVGSNPTDAIPTVSNNVLDTNPGTDSKGPLLAPAYSFSELSQTLLHGGGAVTYNNDSANNYLLWTDRFTIYNAGNNEFCPGNGFSIPVPAAGVAIPVFQSATVTSRSTVAGGIQINASEALYYELPLGNGNTPNTIDPGSTSYLRIVAATHTTIKNFTIPSHWILIARVSPDVSHGNVLLGTGETIDQPHLLTLTGWTNAAGEAPLNVKKINGQLVLIEGAIVSTAGLAANTVSATIATVPPHYRSKVPRHFTVSIIGGSVANAVVNISAAGLITIHTGATAISVAAINSFSGCYVAEV